MFKNNFFIGENVVIVFFEIKIWFFIFVLVYVWVLKEIEKYCEKIKMEDGGRRFIIK